MARDVYAWIDPWAGPDPEAEWEVRLQRFDEVSGPYLSADQAFTCDPHDLAAMLRPGVVQFVPSGGAGQFFAKMGASLDESERLQAEIAAKAWGEPGRPARGDVAVYDGEKWVKPPPVYARDYTDIAAPHGPMSPEPSYPATIPIWLLALIMLGIAFGAPMVVGLLSAGGF